MTHVAIQEEIQKQIEVIKKVNSEVRKSPEKTRKFLNDIGITKDKPEIKTETNSKK